MRKKPSEEEVLTAVHEAGHFVVAWFERMTPSFASIKPDGSSAGRVVIGRSSKSTYPERLAKREGRYFLAGTLAVLMHLLSEGVPPDDAALRACDGNQKDINELADLFPDHSLLAELARETTLRVGILLPAIERVARTLLDETIVYRRRGERIIRDCLPSRSALYRELVVADRETREAVGKRSTRGLGRGEDWRAVMSAGNQSRSSSRTTGRWTSGSGPGSRRGRPAGPRSRTRPGTHREQPDGH